MLGLCSVYCVTPGLSAHLNPEKTTVRTMGRWFGAACGCGVGTEFMSVRLHKTQFEIECRYGGHSITKKFKTI